MLTSVGSVLGSMIGWIGDFVSALVTGGETPGALHALLPLFAIGIAASLCMFAMKMIRKVTWGS